MRSTRCTWIRKNFRAYKANTLAQSDADTLFAHLMFCEGCRSDLWEPQIDRFRESLQGGAWLADLAVHQREARWGSLPTALAASVAGRGARVGHARGLALLGEDRRDRVDVFCRATLVAGTPGGLTVQLPPALEVRGASRTFDAVQQALHHLLPNDLPPVGVEVALDATRPLPKQLHLDGDSLQLPVAIAAATASSADIEPSWSAE